MTKTTETWEERFERECPLVWGGRDWAKDFIRTEIALARQEEAKAYGGCTNCYGKGYSTRKASWEGHGEHDIGTGDVHVSYPAEFYMPCTKCNRGTQFASAMKSTRQEGERTGREKILSEHFCCKYQSILPADYCDACLKLTNPNH